MEFKGSVYTVWHQSQNLIGNLAKTSAFRPLTIYFPTHLIDQKNRCDIALYCLAPWTNAGRSMLDWKPFRESLPARIERLMATGMVPPTMIVCPDLYTEFGGSQYIDSEFFGSHGSYVAHEVVSYINEHYGPKTQAIFGRSSGAFGALRIAMDYPGVFSGVAAHSADLGFSQMFATDLLSLCDKLRRYHHSIEAFLTYTRTSVKLSSSDVHCLMLLGCAGFYSPDRKAKDGYQLPIDLYTGELIPSIWNQWLSHDPVVRVESLQKQSALKELKYLYLECGLRDQYRLLYGARQLHQKLEKFGVMHRYEEFDDDHSGTDYRFDISLVDMIKNM